MFGERPPSKVDRSLGRKCSTDAFGSTADPRELDLDAVDLPVELACQTADDRVQHVRPFSGTAPAPVWFAATCTARCAVDDGPRHTGLVDDRTAEAVSGFAQACGSIVWTPGLGNSPTPPRPQGQIDAASLPSSSRACSSAVKVRFATRQASETQSSGLRFHRWTTPCSVTAVMAEPSLA